MGSLKNVGICGRTRFSRRMSVGGLKHLKRFSKTKMILFLLGKWETNKRIDFVFQFQLGCQYRLDSVVVGMMYASMSFQWFLRSMEEQEAGLYRHWPKNLARRIIWEFVWYFELLIDKTFWKSIEEDTPYRKCFERERILGIVIIITWLLLPHQHSTRLSTSHPTPLELCALFGWMSASNSVHVPPVSIPSVYILLAKYIFLPTTAWITVVSID